MSGFKVIVAGSGLAGNLLANGLINNGVDVEVYERLAQDAKREGYQIRLGASALLGLRSCLQKIQLDDIVKRFGRAGGKFAAAPILYDKNFNVILNVNRFPAYDKSAPISRKILRDILAQPVEKAGKLFYNKAFDRYKILNPGEPGEKVRVWFGDGTSSDCDVLVAADGANSKINQQVGLNNLKTLESHWSFLAKSDLPTSKYRSMSKELTQSPAAISSDGRTLYFCAYLPDDYSSAELSKGEEHRIDESISSCFFGYAVPASACPANIREMALDEQWKFLREQFKQYWCPKFEEMIDLLKGSEIYVYKGRVSTKPAANWRASAKSEKVPEKGHPRVMLVGDAVHAMLPNRGMGGNQAMRDISVLLPILLRLGTEQTSGKASRYNKTVEAACAEFESEMIPRAFDWVQKSGGETVVMADTATWKGRLWLSSVGVLLDVAFAFYWVSSFFVAHKWVDDAPEFQN